VPEQRPPSGIDQLGVVVAVSYDSATTTASRSIGCVGAAAQTAPNASLYERLGGTYGVAGAVDVLADRLYGNVSADQNPHVEAVHALKGHAGFNSWSPRGRSKQTGGPKCYPGRDMRESHAHL